LEFNAGQIKTIEHSGRGKGTGVCVEDFTAVKDREGGGRIRFGVESPPASVAEGKKTRGESFSGKGGELKNAQSEGGRFKFGSKKKRKKIEKWREKNSEGKVRECKRKRSRGKWIPQST